MFGLTFCEGARRFTKAVGIWEFALSTYYFSNSKERSLIKSRGD